MTTSRSVRRADARLAQGRRVGARGRVAATAFAVVVTAGGCATVPTSGAVRQLGGAAQAGVSQEQVYSQPIPVGPGPGWPASDIVAGFLAASASFANHHAVAREYLDPTTRSTWNPGWAVTVVSGMTPLVERFTKELDVAQVTVSGLQVATLTDTGQSLITSGSSPRKSFHFYLTRINGQWRIYGLPSVLLLTQFDFQHVYQPRNLYFLAGSGRTLVPDPVFVPQQDTNTDLATGLVTALLQDPKGWLQGAAVTGFPQKSSLIGQVKINGPNATVDLGGKAVTAGRRQREQMAAQLAWTLESGPTAIQSVEVQVNGRPLQIEGNQFQLAQMYRSWVPTPSAASSLYFISGNKTVRALSDLGQPGAGPGSATAVPGTAGTASVPSLRSIAVSPDGRSIAGISAGGKAVYIGDLRHNAPLKPWSPPSGSCTSLSWDPQGDLWCAAGGIVWVIAPGNGGKVAVAPPAGEEVTAFRVAPDGVRAVMIVHGASGSEVQLVAITHGDQAFSLGNPVTIGAGIADPQAVSWFDANDVIVLAGSPSASQLEEVPLNGGQPTPIPTEGNIVSVTATSPGGSGTDIAIGLSGGQIMVSANLGAFENTHATGQAPIYPG